MTFVTRDAKACDSQRMGKREAATEIRAVIQPGVSERVSDGPRAWTQDRNTPTILGGHPCTLPGLPSLCTSLPGWRKVGRSGKNSIHSPEAKERPLRPESLCPWWGRLCMRCPGRTNPAGVSTEQWGKPDHIHHALGAWLLRSIRDAKLGTVVSTYTTGAVHWQGKFIYPRRIQWRGFANTARRNKTLTWVVPPGISP